MRAGDRRADHEEGRPQRRALLQAAIGDHAHRPQVDGRGLVRRSRRLDDLDGVHQGAGAVPQDVHRRQPDRRRLRQGLGALDAARRRIRARTTARAKARSSGWTTAFPHPLAVPDGKLDTRSTRRWQRSPFADEYLERMAAAAIDSLELGRGTTTDFLGVSFSSVDGVGHVYGPRSHEIQDLLVPARSHDWQAARSSRRHRRHAATTCSG